MSTTTKITSEQFYRLNMTVENEQNSDTRQRNSRKLNKTSFIY